MKKISKSIIALVIVTLIFGMFVPTANAEFPDLRPDHWCYEKILNFEERGYVDGYDDGEFKPDQTITRAEYVTIVNNFFGYEADKEKTAEFLDVSEDDWFEPYVSEAVKRGYISGYPDGTFKPYDPIRRQEATVILSKILNIHEEEYPKDHEDGLAQYDDGEEVDDWAYKAVHSYSVYNFINGYEDNTIRLFRNVTRAETVQLLNTVEEKVVIDRENKANEIKDKPSGGGGSSSKRTATPVINIVENNDSNTWYNLSETGDDKEITINVTTTTPNATIDVKVNGIVISTTPLEVTNGSGVTFTLPEGRYEITATAKRSNYKTSYETKANADVDVQKPVVSGKVNEGVVHLYAQDNLSGIENDGIQYAWFISTDDGTDYIRVSNWSNLEEDIEFPKEPQNYYIGVKGSDIAGNIIDGGLKDNKANIYDKEETPNGTVTDEVKDDPFDIVNEIIVNSRDEDRENEDGSEFTEKVITFHKNDGSDKIYKQNILDEEMELEKDIFSREDYTFVGWAESATGNKVYENGATVKFTESKDLYAIWELNKESDIPVIVEVKLKIEATSGANGIITPSGVTKVKYGASQSYTITPNAGYEIEDVLVDGKSIGKKENYTFDNIVADHTISATFKVIEYKITYNLDGGIAANPENYTVETASFTLANPTKSGYTFVGWTGTGLTSASNSVTIEKGSTGDREYTATFEKDETQTQEESYTVEYYKDGEKVEADTKKEQDKIWIGATEMEVKPVDISSDKYAGYKYDHTDPAEIPSTIKIGGVIKVYYVKDETQTQEESYTVEYYKDGEKVEADTKKEQDKIWIGATEMEVKPVDKSDDKYTGYKYDHTDPAEIPSTIKIGGVIKVYYVKDETQTQEESYTVEYYKDGEKVEADTKKEQDKIWIGATEMEVKPVDISSDKYAGYKYDHTDPAEIPSTIKIDGVIKVYYVINSYKLTVDPNGGTWDNSTEKQTYTQNYNTTKTIENPTAPAGYTVSFNTNGGNAIDSISQEVKFDKWELTESGKLEGKTYTFGAGDGELKAKYEYKKITLPTPKKSGYDFDGWYENENLTGNKITGSYLPTASITLYAKWTEKAPSFEVTKTSNYPIAEVGKTITYTITVKNNGEKAENITVTDDLNGKALNNVKEISNSGKIEENVVIWELTLDAGEKVSLTFMADVTDSAKTGTVIENIATVTARGQKTFDTNKLETSIEKTVSTNAVQTVKKLPDMNVVLVMDLSGSMLWEVNSGETASDLKDARITAAKTAAAQFVQNLYTKANKDERVTFTLVGFNSKKADLGCGIRIEHEHGKFCVVCPLQEHKHEDACYKYTGANVITFDSNGVEVRTATRDNYQDLMNEINNVQAKKDHGTYMNAAMEVVDTEFDTLDENYPDAQNFVILLADGDYDGTEPFDTVDLINRKHKANFYTIGFGPDASNSSSDAYKTLEKISSNKTVYTSSDLTTLLNNFNTILDDILSTNNVQSSKGKIEFVMATSNYYPITIEYKDAEGNKKIEINSKDELAENHITIDEGNNLTWDISGDNYAGCTELKISYNKTTVESETSAMSLFSLAARSDERFAEQQTRLIQEESSDVCDHEWEAATYEEAKTCKKCGETEGEPLEKEIEPEVTHEDNEQKEKTENDELDQDQSKEADTKVEGETVTDTENHDQTEETEEIDTKVEGETVTDTENHDQTKETEETDTKVEGETVTDTENHDQTEETEETDTKVEGETVTDTENHDQTEETEETDTKVEGETVTDTENHDQTEETEETDTETESQEKVVE